MNISDEQYEEMEGRLSMMTGILGYILASGITISIRREELAKFTTENPKFSVVTLPDKDFMHVWLGYEE
jgi:hypothetical protein